MQSSNMWIQLQKIRLDAAKVRVWTHILCWGSFLFNRIRSCDIRVLPRSGVNPKITTFCSLKLRDAMKWGIDSPFWDNAIQGLQLEAAVTPDMGTGLGLKQKKNQGRRLQFQHRSIFATIILHPLPRIPGSQRTWLNKSYVMFFIIVPG